MHVLDYYFISSVIRVSDCVIGWGDDGFPVQPSDPPQMDTQQDYEMLRN